eukprot:CAMPEP_0198114124 /NCGR_PEP_ID=MMETSP1442-20131203/5592_1 /TAXON_ID= /ORGANISM="Craspedostauros australis, Strain CCMP3328" /LENGTH=191 /DNA_ID=CAMNT_0043771359 /DNA_START=101 /DNA_END=676 /DNA_ORIENTATION=+
MATQQQQQQQQHVDDNETKPQQNTWKLRVAGVGYSVILHIPASCADSPTTVGDLKAIIENEIALPARYQRLLARGKPLKDDDAALHEYGIRDRTRVMLLHSAEYAQDRVSFEKLGVIAKEIADLESKATDGPNAMPANVLHELVTQLCCKLDDVDVHGSETLRSFRKKLLRGAEAIEKMEQGGEQETENAK